MFDAATRGFPKKSHRHRHLEEQSIIENRDGVEELKSTEDLVTKIG